MKWRDLLSTDDGLGVHDEEILNVFRRSDDLTLSNSEVGGAVGMTGYGAKGRLEDLEDEGRVKGKLIGNSWGWTLHPDERRKPIPPEIDRLVHFLDDVRGGFRVAFMIGWLITVLGFSLTYWGVTKTLVPVSIEIAPTELVLAGGWILAVSGGMFGFIGGGLIIASLIIEKAAVHRLTESRPPEHIGSPSKKGESRGQVTPRMIIGGIVLLLIAGPLFKAAVDIYQSFAQTVVFSKLQAAVLAILFIALILAAIFGR